MVCLPGMVAGTVGSYGGTYVLLLSGGNLSPTDTWLTQAQWDRSVLWSLDQAGVRDRECHHANVPHILLSPPNPCMEVSYPLQKYKYLEDWNEDYIILLSPQGLLEFITLRD